MAAIEILEKAIPKISVKLIIEKPLKTKFNKTNVGMIKPKRMGIKHTIKHTIFLKLEIS